jgi:hypothetical protein
MAGQRITIQITGASSDGQDVRLPELIEQLQTLKKTLAFAEKDVPEDQRAPVYYKVIDLKHDSPALLTVEPVPFDVEHDPTNIIVARFQNRFSQIERDEVPDGVGLDELEAYQAFAPKPDRKITEVRITVEAPTAIREQNRFSEYRITSDFERKVAAIIGPDEIAWGSLTGRLEAVNVHNKANTFNLYPIVGARKVSCTFESAVRDDVKAALDHYVEVFGRLRYKNRYRFPHAISGVHHIDVLDANLETAPHLSDLRGFAPDATGGMDVREYVDGLDEDW